MYDLDIKRFLETIQCEFSFNVPAASQIGGSWERMICTMKNVISGIWIERDSGKPDSSSLRTPFYERVYIANSRPLNAHQLTADSSVEPLPMTLTHSIYFRWRSLLYFLLQQSLKNRTFTAANAGDTYNNYLAEQFWTRWKPEYLQCLQKRNTWSSVQSNVVVNDIFMPVENDWPCSALQLGRDIENIERRDGLTIKVRIRAGSKQALDRPVHKLTVLVSATIH